mgnify:CR=1 FL=1
MGISLDPTNDLYDWYFCDKEIWNAFCTEYV